MNLTLYTTTHRSLGSAPRSPRGYSKQSTTWRCALHMSIPNPIYFFLGNPTHLPTKRKRVVKTKFDTVVWLNSHGLGGKRKGRVRGQCWTQMLSFVRGMPTFYTIVRDKDLLDGRATLTAEKRCDGRVRGRGRWRKIKSLCSMVLVIS